MIYTRNMLKVTGVLAILCVGCFNSGPDYHQVSGNVTFNGQPVPLGEVSFTPNSAEGNSGPSVVCPINEGKYQSPAGRGVVGGAYIAVISGFQKASPSNDPTASDYGQRLFPVQRKTLALPDQDSQYDFEF